MKLRILTLFGFALWLTMLATLPANAQRVDPRNTHVRMWAIDTVVFDKLGRPSPAHKDGMLGYVVIFHKDVKDLCAVEYVAQSKAAHAPLVSAAAANVDPRVKIFDRDHTKPEVFQAALKAAGFQPIDLEKFVARIQ